MKQKRQANKETPNLSDAKPIGWRFQVIIPIMALLVSIAAFIISYCSYSGQKQLENRVNEEKLAERKVMAEISIRDFNNWLKINNNQFEHEYDSLKFYLSKLNPSGGPEHISAKIKFARNFRMKRDVTIDSMFVRMKQYDINTDTIKFNRKLPMAFANDINWILRKDDYEVKKYFEDQKFDTL
ncbi:MAG: hypothetical protein R3F48_06715 [Candidatus Zixiibacteriota bacterium]